MKKIFLGKNILAYGILFALSWSVLVGLSLALTLYQVRNETIAVARNVARTNANRDVLYRKWNTMHGGVYVPVSEHSPPCPSLAHIPERDLTTPSDRKLTLVNAPYMLTQVNNLSQMDNYPTASIKSLNPMQPENAPDGWEAAALKKLDQGAKEVSEVVRVNGSEIIRFMSPLPADFGCMVNRPTEGVRAGDIVGGLSLSVPLSPFQELTSNHMRLMWAGHLSIWLAGLLGTGYTFIRLRQNLKENESLQSQLNQAQKLEAVGRLSGGIAHDFNNLLTTIVGYSELSMMRLSADDPLREDIEHMVPQQNLWVKSGSGKSPRA